MSEESCSPSIVAKIERSQHRRLLLLSVSAIAFLIWVSSDAWPVAPGTRRAVELICAAAFLVWIVSLIAMLSSGVTRNQVVRAAMNDELAVAHRRSALMFGYWVLIALLAALYTWSFFSPIAVREVAPLLLAVAVAAPILRFVALERRSEQDG